MTLTQDDRLALLSAIVDSSDDAIISKDLDGIITSWNKSAERLFGYSAEEAIGKSITILIPAHLQSEEPDILRRIRRGEPVEHFETTRQRKDGSLVDVSLSISPVRDGTGTIAGASKIARDITDMKRGERANRLLSAIVDSSDDAIISKDLNGIITSWNKSAERLFGYTAEEATGQPITMLIPDDRQSEEPDIISRIRRGERVEHFETIRQRKDGSPIDISLTISPVRDRQGTIVGASKIARDITESKRLVADLQRSNELLEQFAYAASHDLQEPLRTVKIYGELLMREYSNRFDTQGLKFLQHLHTGATRMQTMVRDLLAYARITRFERPTEKCDANLAFETAMESLGNTISESNAKVTAEPLPRLQMHFAHLQQLFQNLVGNAIKYRHAQRPPVIQVSAQKRKRLWEFTVRDNGIGIEPEYKDTVFGLFKRLHSAEEYPGTGLGLAICQRIIEQYGGRIWVESKGMDGSVFKFVIPD